MDGHVKPGEAHARATREGKHEKKPAVVGRGVGEHLRQLAASELALYWKTKAAHWTVFGPHFRELHKLLDKQAEVSLEAIDLLAERAAQLDAVPPVALAEVMDLSVIEDRTAPKLGNREALEALAADLATLCGSMKEAVAEADGGGDPATVDILSEIVRDHELSAWFLRQTLMKNETDL